MNERIKLLAEQAGIQMFEDRAFGWSVIAGTDHNVQRFVELIVADCLYIVEPMQDSGDEWCVTLKATAQAIKEHFEISNENMDHK